MLRLLRHRRPLTTWSWLHAVQQPRITRSTDDPRINRPRPSVKSSGSPPAMTQSAPTSVHSGYATSTFVLFNNRNLLELLDYQRMRPPRCLTGSLSALTTARSTLAQSNLLRPTVNAHRCLHTTPKPNKEKRMSRHTPIEGEEGHLWSEQCLTERRTQQGPQALGLIEAIRDHAEPGS